MAFALLVRFLMELTLLAGAGILAAHIAPSGWGWLAAIAAVTAVATVWGMLLSPKARIDIPPWARLLLEAVLFGLVGVGLAVRVETATIPALLGIALWAIDRAAIAVLAGHAERSPAR